MLTNHRACCDVLKSPPAIRFRMSSSDGSLLSQHLLNTRGGEDENRRLDQLWLRAVLIEQWRRTPLAERATFEAQADFILSALD